jgi:hypothetical protein
MLLNQKLEQGLCFIYRCFQGVACGLINGRRYEKMKSINFKERKGFSKSKQREGNNASFKRKVNILGDP